MARKINWLDEYPRPLRTRRRSNYAGLPEGIKVDAADRHLLDEYAWRINGHGYVVWNTFRGGKGLTVSLARLILQAKPNEYVDHINGDRLDNRRANLRIVTAGENAQNRTRQDRRNTSGARGVSYHKGRRKWRAEAKVDGRSRHVGLFDTRKEAEVAARRFREARMSGLTPFSV